MTDIISAAAFVAFVVVVEPDITAMNGPALLLLQLPTILLIFQLKYADNPNFDYCKC